MSHTDKDRPRAVRALDPLEPGRYVVRHRSSEGWTNCGWVIRYNYYTSSVPRWFRISTWYSPERRRERDVLHDAVREYNAGCDLEDFDFPNYQHRHRSQWYWD